MKDQMPPAPLAFLAGPTASGKSALAIEFALARNLAILSADSMQVYRGMGIGTGAITPGEMRGVPHGLIAALEPHEEFHAAKFVRFGTMFISQQWEQHRRRTLVVGGTGLWIEALREGLFDGPGRDETIRAAHSEIVAHEGSAALHARLADVDPQSAARLLPSDTVRVSRALEVHTLTGRTMTEWLEVERRRKESLGPLPPIIVLNPPREELRRRIAERVDSMLAAGWLEETRRFRALSLPPNSPAAKALGYRELIQVLDGDLSIDAARDLIINATRQYARRQLAWFRSRRDVHWLWPPSIEALDGIVSAG